MTKMISREEDHLSIFLVDGTRLFTITPIINLTNIRETSMGPMDFGSTVFLQTEQWCELTDGTKMRCDHLSMMCEGGPAVRMRMNMDSIWTRFFKMLSRVAPQRRTMTE